MEILKKTKGRIMNIKEKVYGHILNAMAYAQNVSDWEDCREKAKTISKLIIKRCLHEHKHCPQCGKWVHRDTALPEKNQRVLVFSPMYSGVDPAMEYRIMDGQFVKISRDVEYWMIPDCGDDLG